jgi:pimeloyl-ACP methyl ester carboxylesterase
VAPKDQVAGITDLHEACDGLPNPSQLGLLSRIIMEGSAISDYGLRTAASTLVAATAAPLGFAPGRLRREREELKFYQELASRQDPAASFPPPSSDVTVNARRVVPLSFRPSDGRVESLRFESPFEARHPAVRARYAKFSHNHHAYAQYWRHDDRPRPTLCVIHGFMGSPYWLNAAFFSLPWFYGHGYDVLLYTLPFHGRRQSRAAPFSGHGFFANGISHMNEAMAHAVHDFRVFVDHLRARGVPRIGVTGLSLGGYMSALLAAVEERLFLAVPNAAVTDLSEIIAQWFPAGQLLDLALRIDGIPRRDVAAALAFHSPLTYPALLPTDRLMIIAGLGDRLAPPQQSQRLWEHWGHCDMHWYPGNHVLHVNRAAYLKGMGRFMQSTGFSE